MTSGEKIRFIRIHQDLTAEELAQKINEQNIDDKNNKVTASLVSAYERGARNASDKALAKFAAALDVNIEALRPDEISSEVAMHTLFRLEHQFEGILMSSIELKDKIRQELVNQIKNDIEAGTFDIKRYENDDFYHNHDDENEIMLTFAALDVPMGFWLIQQQKLIEGLEEAKQIKKPEDSITQSQLCLDSYQEWKNNFRIDEKHMPWGLKQQMAYDEELKNKPIAKNRVPSRKKKGKKNG